ncbi:hypothetical protein DENIS_0617 [Desulfonema ishimotonii]|uniref:Flavodoxin domain-containing protein n=1 Tax=Desulfonema ishimotonii TaxID=45657 RepID=A0A401FRT8_9BACT|nr:flavodoxin domain-containing protein [Desulfonema ishimotonii]GBC59676.1 hypothetical protein DENIS_0617 [Desulfonema ishimotonii]
MKSLVLFDSMSGNTEKVAAAICKTLESEAMAPQMTKVGKETDLDFYDYDLVCVGSPVIDWLPTQTMMNFIKKKLKGYNRQGLIKPAAPIIPGKFGVCFGTFAGPHIGEREALPMTMWFRSFLEHIGFTVLDSWHIVGQFNNREDLNISGRLGNIRNRPNENDLADVENRVRGVLASLEAWRS